MRHISRALRTLALIVVAATGCRSPGPTAPTDPLSGAWTGTITDSVSGAGILTVTMTQVGSSAAGAWSATFQNGTDSRTGSASATINGSAATLFLTPTIGITCSPAATLSGTLAVAATLSGASLSGTYVALACTGTTTGRVDLTRAD